MSCKPCFNAKKSKPRGCGFFFFLSWVGKRGRCMLYIVISVGTIVFILSHKWIVEKVRKKSSSIFKIIHFVSPVTQGSYIVWSPGRQKGLDSTPSWVYGACNEKLFDFLCLSHSRWKLGYKAESHWNSDSATGLSSPVLIKSNLLTPQKQWAWETNGLNLIDSMEKSQQSWKQAKL